MAITCPSPVAGQLLVGVAKRCTRVMEVALAAAGTSLAQTKLLHQLEGGPTRQSVLAELLGVAARTVTETVDGLERAGLARRLEDTTDRRAKLVAITEAGRDALAAGLVVRERVWHDIFSGLDDLSRATLVTLLGALDASPALSSRSTP